MEIHQPIFLGEIHENVECFKMTTKKISAVLAVYWQSARQLSEGHRFNSTSYFHGSLLKTLSHNNLSLPLHLHEIAKKLRSTFTFQSVSQFFYAYAEVLSLLEIGKVRPQMQSRQFLDLLPISLLNFLISFIDTNHKLIFHQNIQSKSPPLI